jgi:hypothetical protein
MAKKPATIEFLRNGLVAPLTKLSPASSGKPGTFDGGVYYDDGSICQAGIQVKGAYTNQPLPYSSEATPKFIAGYHIFGGMLQNAHFGHFIAESLTRVWATRHLNPTYKSIVFYLRAKEYGIKSFVTDAFDTILPGISIIFADVLTSFENLAVPSQLGDDVQGFIYGYPENIALLEPLRVGSRSGARRIYVSRSRLKGHEGGILLESLIEKNLAKEGYEIIYPETMSISEQFAAYRSADDLIFAEGSAAHLYAMAARPGQRSFMIWRRRHHGSFEMQIKSFSGETLLGLPSVRELWVPETQPHETVSGQAVLDFAALRDQLLSFGFISDASWELPTATDFAVDLKRNETAAKRRMVRYPQGLLGRTLLSKTAIVAEMDHL